jgi:hypothetical protein
MQAVLSECLRSGQVVMMTVDENGTPTMTKYPLKGDRGGSDSGG